MRLSSICVAASEAVAQNASCLTRLERVDVHRSVTSCASVLAALAPAVLALLDGPRAPRPLAVGGSAPAALAAHDLLAAHSFSVALVLLGGWAQRDACAVATSSRCPASRATVWRQVVEGLPATADAHHELGLWVRVTRGHRAGLQEEANGLGHSIAHDGQLPPHGAVTQALTELDVSV